MINLNTIIDGFMKDFYNNTEVIDIIVSRYDI